MCRVVALVVCRVVCTGCVYREVALVVHTGWLHTGCGVGWFARCVVCVVPLVVCNR